MQVLPCQSVRQLLGDWNGKENYVQRSPFPISWGLQCQCNANTNANANANANGKENYMQMSPFPMCTAIAMDRKSSCCPYWQSIQMYRLKFSATENEFINHFRNWTIISVSL